MKLTDLEPQFLKNSGSGRMLYVDAIDEADGVMFLCPKCFTENSGPVGTHMIICWFIGKVPDDLDPGPGRWSPVGTGLHDMSLVAGSSSILLTSGCRWHGYVKNGEIVDA